MAYLEGEYAQYIGGRENFDRFDPLLVALHDNLKSLKNDKDNNALYHEVENSIVNLLGANLQTTDKTSVAEIVIGIIKQARKDVQASLSEKLSVRDDLHPSLLHFLAYEEIHIAEPVLLNSTQLSNVDILYIIQAKDKKHWQVIARRPEINEDVIACLASKADEETNIHLLDNETISICDTMLHKIAEMSSESTALADKLVNYKTLPADIATAIYWNVSVSLREEVVQRFDVKPEVVDAALEDSVQDFTDTVLKADNMTPSDMMVITAENLHAEDSITGEMLVDCLRRRQGRFFIALFTQKTGLAHSTVASILRQGGGQGLAVACRATNISKKDFVSIFLLTSAIARSHQPVGADELRMAIRYYESLTHKMAKEILEDSIAR